MVSPESTGDEIMPISEDCNISSLLGGGMAGWMTAASCCGLPRIMRVGSIQSRPSRRRLARLEWVRRRTPIIEFLLWCSGLDENYVIRKTQVIFPNLYPVQGLDVQCHSTSILSARPGSRRTGASLGRSAEASEQGGEAPWRSIHSRRSRRDTGKKFMRPIAPRSRPLPHHNLRAALRCIAVAAQTFRAATRRRAASFAPKARCLRSPRGPRTDSSPRFHSRAASRSKA